jgi:Lrp/AsnC family leucine-responsive transcriptional regulator
MRRLHDLDQKDREILALLEADARRSNSEVARLTGLSAPTVAERIARLRDTGIIRRFSVKLDPAKIGASLGAIVEFQPRSMSDHDGIAFVANHPAVYSCYRITGPMMMILFLRVPDRPSLTRVLGEFIRYGETRTSVILTTESEDRPHFAERHDERII